MYKKILFITIVFFISSGILSKTYAQMMNYGNPSITASPIDIQQQDEAVGKMLFNQLQNKQTTCQNLTNTDFEKIGEYVMSQRFNNTQTHIQMNNNIKQMMGDIGEENMHTRLGIAATGCNTNFSRQGGGNTMMGWGGYGYGNMMNGNFGWGFATFHFLIALVVLVDLIFVGVWLWQQISSHKRK